MGKGDDKKHKWAESNRGKMRRKTHDKKTRIEESEGEVKNKVKNEISEEK